MTQRRLEGKSHLFVNNSSFLEISDLTTGFIVRALGNGLKIALVDLSLKQNKTFSLFENLSLSKSFVRNFPRFHIETFILRKNDKINKCILPLVEYYTIDEKMFWEELIEFEYVVIYDDSLSNIDKIKLKSFLRNKNPESEVLLISKDKNDIKLLDSETDYQYQINTKKESSVFEKRKITSITGKSSARSLISFGYILRKCMEKHHVKVIEVEKGDKIFGEKVFFNSFKQWMRMNIIYGTFDYVSTGNPRFDTQLNFKGDSDEKDHTEAKEALMLIKTSLKKQTPVLADNLLSLIELDLVSENDISELFKSVNNELIITGIRLPEKYKNIITNEIEIEEINPKKETKLKKGLDF